MIDNLSRHAISAMLPPGSLWDPEPDGDLDHLFDGMSENYEEVLSFVASLAYIREPSKTIILKDLEKEFGITDNDTLTVAQRIDRLASAKYIKNSDGSKDTLQSRLQRSGFNVQVHENNPPVDPSLFVGGNFKTVCGSPAAICGASGVICGTANSNELLVNGELIFHSPGKQSVVCGSNTAICGSAKSACGSFISNPDINKVTYTLPSSPGYDHLIFFIGGDATRNGSGELLTISPAAIQASRRDEFVSIILDYKPMHSWAGLVVEYSL